jgi:glycogen debranching enzyme
MSNNSYEVLQKDNALWNLGFDTIKELETDLGIMASGREEIYGCIFGRDSLITSLKLLRVYEQTKDPYFLNLVKKVLENLSVLQGTTINIESGEEPGKCIHEFRTSNHEHLTKRSENPWYVYPDDTMRNYDSIDATPLLLIAFYRYLQASGDQAFIDEKIGTIKAALNWLTEYADTNGDGFIDYRLHADRKYGGLITQSWMDSTESVFHEDGSPIAYPIAPVEAQSYAFLAYRLWSIYFFHRDNALTEALDQKAESLKTAFNATFVMNDSVGLVLAAGIDGNGKLLSSVRSSMGHVLWASLDEKRDGIQESILSANHIPELVNRIMAPDLFAPKAGIRTLSTYSSCYSANSYHNGSIWPHDTSIIAEGFELFGFKHEAQQIRTAVLSALTHFNTPIELFTYIDDMYAEYSSPLGQSACKKQAWSAASLLKEIVSEN